MTVQLSRLFARFALFGVLAFALGLAACGRKSGLDPPPPSAAVALPPGGEQPGVPGSPPAVTPDGRPVAPSSGLKRQLPIDPILD